MLIAVRALHISSCQILFNYVQLQFIFYLEIKLNVFLIRLIYTRCKVFLNFKRDNKQKSKNSFTVNMKRVTTDNTTCPNTVELKTSFNSIFPTLLYPELSSNAFFLFHVSNY